MRKYLALFLALMTLVCLIGCNNESVVQMGTLNIEIDSSVSRGIQAISMDTSSYNLTIKNSSSGEVVYNVAKSTKTSYSISVPIGTYVAEVEALNSAGDIIGTGSATGNVAAGQNNEFIITITEPQGIGLFAISISANEGYELSYSIRDAAGLEVKNALLSFSEGIYSAAVELNNGFYSFSIIRNDTSKVLKSDTVRIIKGRNASYKAEFLFLTDGSLIIQNQIVQTPTIRLNSSSAFPKIGDTFSVSATIANIGNYSCYWALDGVALSEPQPYDDLEIEITDALLGQHEITLFVTDGTVVWSESKVITVNRFNTSVEVSGDIEIFVVGNVFIPNELQVLVSIGNIIGTKIRPYYHRIFEDEPEGTVLSVSNVNVDGYFAYIETENDTINGRTVVYFVIDKDIENPAYITLHSEYEMNLEDGQYQYLHFSHNDGNSRIYETVVLTNNKDDRIIKIEPNLEYTFRGNSSSTGGRYINVSANSFSVDAGENTTINLTRSPYGTISAIAPQKYDTYEVFFNDSMNCDSVVNKGETFVFEELTTEKYCVSFIPTYGTENVTSYYSASGTPSEGINEIELDEVDLDFFDCNCTLTGDGFDFAYDVRAVVPEYGISFLKIGDKVFNMRTYNNGHLGYQFDNAALSTATGPGFEGYKISASCEDDTITLTYDLTDDEYATLNLVYDFEYDETYDGACAIVWLDDKKYLLDLTGEPSSLKVKPGTYSGGGSVRYGGTGTNWIFVSSGFTVSAGQTITVHLKNELN